VEGFLEAARSRAFWIPAPPRRFLFNRDPKDEPYINLEIAAQAEFLVSRDNDILDLAKPDDADAVRLRAIAPDIRIVEPREFVRDVRRKEAAGGDLRCRAVLEGAEAPPVCVANRIRRRLRAFCAA
jgi:hypothetical protein